MIPLIRREIALREGWIEDKDILDILAVSESTPGPIAVNTATFVGYRLAGPWGAAAATVGVVLPSFVIIFALSFVLRQFEELPAVRYAFWGIRVAVVALVCSAWSPWPRSAPGTSCPISWRQGRSFWWDFSGPIPLWCSSPAPWLAWLLQAEDWGMKL